MPYFIKFLVSEIKGKYSEKTNTCAENDKKIIEKNIRELEERIKQELEEKGLLDQYRISQIKEKYGALCWYDFGCTEKIWTEIIPKYEKLSTRTCIKCGKPATKVTLGWVSPYCDDCCPDFEYTTSVEEYEKGVHHKII